MFVREIYHIFLKNEVAEVNQKIQEAVSSPRMLPELRPIMLEAASKGRRFRPLLMILTHKGFGGQWRDIVRLACAIELLHKASLIHDDLVDGDCFRRGCPTLWRQVGHREALIIGDLLIGVAFGLVAKWTQINPHMPADTIFEIFAQTLTNASIGEWLDLRFESIEIPGPAWLKKMTILKSGVLIAASMQLGAITSGASQRMQELFKTLGMQIGFIFQTMNDLNNFNEVDCTSKKGSGQDMALGKKNIVTEALYAQGINFKEFCGLSSTERSICLKPVIKTLGQQIDQAKRSVEQLPKGEIKGLFVSLLDSYSDNWFWIDEDQREDLCKIHGFNF
jgi:geranylgeranyl diphosphate synthase type I